MARLISDDVKEEARRRRAEGQTIFDIARELSLSTGTVSNLTRDIKLPKKETIRAEPGHRTVEPGTEKAAVFLDVEGRFKGLLEKYRVADAGRIVEFVSTQGGDIYREIPKLRDALSMQGLARAKINPLLAHWAAAEGLPVPEDIISRAPEQSRVKRYSVVGDEILEDPDGELTWVQALQYLEVKRAPASPTEKPELAALKSLVQSQLEEMRALREQAARAEIDELKAAIVNLTRVVQDERGKVNEYTIMSDALKEGAAAFREVSNKVDRTVAEVRQWVLSRPLRPLTEAEKTAIKDGITEVAQEEAKAEAEYCPRCLEQGARTPLQPGVSCPVCGFVPPAPATTGRKFLF